MFFKKILNGLKKISSVVFVTQYWLYANAWQRTRLVTSIVLNLVDTGAKLLGPLALAKSIEMVAESKKEANFFGAEFSAEMLLVIATTANSIHFVMPNIKRIVLYGIQEDFARSLSQKIIEASQKKSISVSDATLSELLKESSKHLQCANFETGQLLSTATESIHPLFLDITLGIGFTFFRFDRSVGGVLLGYIFVSILTNEMLSRVTKITKRSQQVGMAFSGYMKDFYEVLINTETIHLLNRQQLENRNLSAAYNKYLKLNKRNVCYENFWIMQPLLACIVQFLAVYYVIRDDFQKVELDDIIFLINYALNIGGSVNLINKSFQSGMHAAESLSEIDNFISCIESVEQQLDSVAIQDFFESETSSLVELSIPWHISQPSANFDATINTKHKIAIEFKNVSFYYVSEYPILNLVNFKIYTGKKTGLAGISGGGKTTILKLISRLIEPTNSEAIIKIFGKDIRDIPTAQLRELISVTKQYADIFQENSLKYNVLYGFADEDSLHQLKLFEATEPKNEEVESTWTTSQYDTTLTSILKDVKLDEVADKKACRELSGGQRSRASLAQILPRFSSIFVFDESTANLDSKTEEHVLNSVKQRLKEKTVIMIAHRLSTIKDSDKILVIDKKDNNGATVVEEGNHDELLEKDGAYAQLWRLQTR